MFALYNDSDQKVKTTLFPLKAEKKKAAAAAFRNGCII